MKHFTEIVTFRSERRVYRGKIIRRENMVYHREEHPSYLLADQYAESISQEFEIYLCTARLTNVVYEGWNDFGEQIKIRAYSAPETSQLRAGTFVL